VSIHNNYFTFPVIVLMVSGHFPGVYGSHLNWVMLLVLVAGGAAARHVLNVRFGWPAWKPALAGVILVTVAALVLVLRSGSGATALPASVGAGPVSFAEARHVIDRRCGACHSSRPSEPSISAAPAGVMFDTPEQIVARAARIRERVVVTRTMPLGNRTGITDDERALLGRWVEQGAKSDLVRP
jgi:uncharacterized membrane protein